MAKKAAWRGRERGKGRKGEGKHLLAKWSVALESWKDAGQRRSDKRNMTKSDGRRRLEKFMVK